MPRGNLQSALVDGHSHRAAGGGVQYACSLAAIGFDGLTIEGLVTAAQNHKFWRAPGNEAWWMALSA
jgi:hypothetical protein